MEFFDTLKGVLQNAARPFFAPFFLALFPFLEYIGDSRKKQKKVGDTMAFDIFKRKKTYPCDPATHKDLSDAINLMSSGIPYDKLLSPIICPISPEWIPWSNIRNLFILGDYYSGCNDALTRENLKDGIYINHSGDSLLLVHPKEQQVQHALDRCGPRLKDLWARYIRFTSIEQSATTELFRITYGSLDLSATTELEHLTLRDHSLSRLSGLENLTTLTELHLSTCHNLSQIPSLDNLSQLTSLNLSNNYNLTQLPSLDNLSQLTSLDLSNCQILAQIPSLDNVSQLTSLDLSYCKSLTQLPSLDNLSQLTSLNLSDCKSLTQLPSLDNLSQLTSLNLSGCDNLTQLPSLDNLSQLTSLNLSYCQCLTQLPSLDNLSCITSLVLYGCRKLTQLPDELRQLENLRWLDLRLMYLQTLPNWLLEIAEGFSMDAYTKAGKKKAIISLRSTTVADIPDMSIFDQPYEVIAEFFRNRSLGKTRALNEIKVVFLGDGEAGKSHTIARLMNDGGEPKDYQDQATPGIVIKRKHYPLGDRTFQVNYWDFGGQEIMHSMHRIFLTSRTMYVVLLNARDDTQADRAHYWLHNIRSFAPGAPVLLVLNKMDQNPNASVDERTLKARYPGLTQIVKLSALNASREDFNRIFTDTLMAEIQKTGYLDADWPGSWIKVKQELENMETHYILGTQYRAICDRCEVRDVQTELLHWFNDLGVSFCFCDAEDYALKRHVILRPDWITNGLYIILFNHCPGAHNGRLPHKSIYELLERAAEDNTIKCTTPGARYDQPGDIEYVLGVMRKFQLSLDTGDRHEFIPMLCQQNSTVDFHDYEKDTDTLEFRMDFEYLPDNLLHRLMVERHAELDMDNVWRKGAKFQLTELGLSAVVVIDGNALRFFIQSKNPMHRSNIYLAILKANVDRIVKKMGLKEPKNWLIYKIGTDRAIFNYERILKLHAKGRKEDYCEALDRDFLIEDILTQSAPERLEDERKLLDAITRACRHLQDERVYRLVRNADGSGYENGHGMEDLRNRRVRDGLQDSGYIVSDQTQRGGGELDILVYGENNEPWTIIEALRVSDGTKRTWNQHLDKLLGRYNTHGLPRLYLLTYVDADPQTFIKVWKGYQGYIPTNNSGEFTCDKDSFTVLTDENDPHYIQAAKCRYTCDTAQTTVYHIFARIPTQNE